MTILMMVVVMMVLMLIIMVKPKQQGSTHYQKSTVNVQYFTHVHSHAFNSGISSQFPASSSMFSVELSLKGGLCICLLGRKGSLNSAFTVLSNNGAKQLSERTAITRVICPWKRYWLAGLRLVTVSLALWMLILIIISTVNKVVLWWVIGTAKKNFTGG